MDVEKLITEVYVRAPLWDQAHPDHHNRHVLQIIWNEVATELDCARDMVQKKWKYLRDYFRSEFIKKTRLESGDAGGVKFTSSWPHFESMRFLINQMSGRPSIGNLRKHANSSQASPAVESSPVEILLDPEEVINNDQLDFEGVSQNERQLSEQGKFPEEPRRNLFPNRKRKTKAEVIGGALLNLEREKIRLLRVQNSKKKFLPNIDEDQSFFESLIPHVKKINQENKLLFRNEIQELVQRFAYGERSAT